MDSILKVFVSTRPVVSEHLMSRNISLDDLFPHTLPASSLSHMVRQVFWARLKQRQLT